LQIKAKKASWSMGSSFPLKKATKVLPKIQIDDDSELIDEDSLLTEEDLKKPQLPVGRPNKPVTVTFAVFQRCLIWVQILKFPPSMFHQLGTVKLEQQGRRARTALVAGPRLRLNRRWRS
jgi:hypothetical protein